MKVVDGLDGAPISGAHVLFQGKAHEGTFTGHGGRVVNLFVVGAVTDDTGEFRLEKQEFSSQPFLMNTNYHNPSMVVLKSGYALEILANNLRIIPILDEVTTWQYDKQTIKMKRAATDKDLLRTLTNAAVYADLPVDEKSFCSWKRIPRFLVALDNLATEWNRKRTTLADAALRNRIVSSPLQKILMNDKYFAEQDCGSPKVFFEPLDAEFRRDKL